MRPRRRTAVSLALLTASTCLVRPASAQEAATPVRAERIRVASPRESPLPEELAWLPSDTAVALFAPRLESSLGDLAELASLLSALDPAFTRPSTRSGLGTPRSSAASLHFTRALFEAATHGLSRSSPALLRTAGIGPEAPVVLVAHLGDGPVVLSIGLENRKQFLDWLSSRFEQPGLQVSIGRELAYVYQHETESPVACLARTSRAHCQIGASAGGDPLASLKRALDGGGENLGSVPGLAEAFRRLPPEGRTYLVVSARGLRSELDALVEAKSRRYKRFAPTDAPPASEDPWPRLAALAGPCAQASTGLVAGLYRERGATVVRAHVALTSKGKAALAAMIAPGEVTPALRRWASTPALVQLLTRLRPEFAEELAGRLGLAPRSGMISGAMAALVLGVDAESSAARNDGRPMGLEWLFAVPSAFSFELFESIPPEEIRQALRMAMRADASPVAEPSRAELSEDGERPIVAEHEGGPVEARLFDRFVLIGTGPGSAAAATRRAAFEGPSSESIGGPSTFFEAAVFLRAIDAAFASSSFTSDHRPELLELEAWRLKAKPLLESMPVVKLRGDANLEARDLSVELRMGR